MKIKNHQNLVTLITSSRGIKTLATVQNCFIQTLRIYLLLLLCIVLFGNIGSGLNFVREMSIFIILFTFSKENFLKTYSRHVGHGFEIQLNQ